MIFEIIGWFCVSVVGGRFTFYAVREFYYAVRYRGALKHPDKFEMAILIFIILVGSFFLWAAVAHIPFEITYKSHI